MRPKIFSRDYLLSFFAQFSFSSVFCILIPAIPIYLHRFGAKEGEIGFLIGIFSVSSLAFRPFVGRALLTIPERNFMIAGTFLYILSCLAYLVAPPFWPLLIVRSIHGVGMALFATSSFTLLANMTPEAHRGRLISYFYLSFNLAFALGPYVGLLLINHFNFTVLFLACAGLSSCSLYLTFKLEKRQPIVSEQEPLRIRSFLSRGAIPPALIAFMLNIIWASIAAFFPLYALQHGVINPGLFFFFLAITLMLGRVLGGRLLDIYDRRKVIMLCLTLILIIPSWFAASATTSCIAYLFELICNIPLSPSKFLPCLGRNEIMNMVSLDSVKSVSSSINKYLCVLPLLTGFIYFLSDIIIRSL